MTESYDLRFGDIDMSPAAQVDDVEYRVYGLRRGYPAPAIVVVNSMLQDGADERIDRHENRDQQIVIGLRSADTGLLAEAESALFLECQKVRNELAWTPADGYGATTVFDVLWASLEFADADDWDIVELRQCERVYTLTVRARPFGRSEEEVEAEGLTSGASPSTTVISDGSSATNWTGDSTVTSTSGQLRMTRSVELQYFTSGVGFTYTASGSYVYAPGSPIDFSTTPYLFVEYANPPLGNVSNSVTVTAFVDGAQAPLVAVESIAAVDGVSMMRAWFIVSDASVSTVVVSMSSRHIRSAGATEFSQVTYRLDNVTRTNQAPNLSTTGRQSMRTIDVEGSARTEASLAIEHETDPLADTIVYTSPALGSEGLGYQPPLRRWRVGGGGSTETTDANTVSGARETLLGSSVNVPASSLPEGTYLLMGRLRATTDDKVVTVSWSASTLVGSTNIGTRAVVSPQVSLTTGDWTVATLGLVTLPTAAVAASSAASIRLHGFSATVISGGSGSAEWDEMWLFHLGEGSALSHFACGGATGSPEAGTRHNRLWLDTASLSSPLPAAWVGTLADRSDAFGAGVFASAWGVHSFTPPSMNVFVVTTRAANPVVTLRHFPRWHTHAAHVEEAS